MNWSDVTETAHLSSKMLERWFPLPKILYPQSAGIDISDTSVKWLSLVPLKVGGFRVGQYGSKKIPDGTVERGVVKNMDALIAVLKDVKKEIPAIVYAHVALPEEAAYVFSMKAGADASREQTLSLVEFEFNARVPITPAAAVYDFDVIDEHAGENMREIAVSVFPRDLTESYVHAMQMSGFSVLSLEIEARSVARAVSSAHPENDPTTLLVDFGRARTGFALLQRGVPIFTSTVEVGGNDITQAIVERLHLSENDAETFKNEQGLFASGSAEPILDVMIHTAGMLSDEISRHFHYWDTRRSASGQRMTPVERVMLVGGGANMRGLADYVAGKVQAPVERGDVWSSVCDLNVYIPPIDRHKSLQYATSIGLALRGV